MLKLLPDNLEAINAHVKDLGWIPPTGTLSNPRPAGPGNMNRTLRFDCSACGEISARGETKSSGEMDSLILKQAVPFVAKYPDIAAPIERGAAEAAFYHAIQNQPKLEARLPRMLGNDPANYLLAFEDLGQAADLTSAYGDEHIQQRLGEFVQPLMQWLGELHAITPPILHNRSMRELNHTHIFELPLQSDNGLELGELADVAERCANHQQLKEAALRLGEIYTGKSAHASAPVLLHGDFYPGSWLGTLDNPADIKVIDPEFAFAGPAEFDVGVCLAHLQFAGMTLEQASTALEHYKKPSGFDSALARSFAGIELIRRLLGVAQLPLPETTSTQTKIDWLETGCSLVLAGQVSNEQATALN